MGKKMSKKTFLYDFHQKAGAKIVDFGGFLLPLQYEGIVEEHKWCRKNCCIFDTSHMGEFFIEGNIKEINKLVTIDIKNTKNKRCRYSFFLNERGGIVDDIIVYKFNDEKFMFVVNSANIEKDKKHILQNLKNCNFRDFSSVYGKIDVQGPEAKNVLEENFNIKLDLKYFKFDIYKIFEQEVIISNSGYTGGPGYEIYARGNLIKKIWEEIVKDRRVKPAGLGARDTLRIESGLPLYGNDINENTNPFEADLGKFVDIKKDFFIGQDALKNIKIQKIRKMLLAETKRPLRKGDLFIENKEVGYITSGSFSPILNKGIGIGYIYIEFKDRQICETENKISCKIFSIGEFKIQSIALTKSSE